MDSIDYADPETINGLNLYAYCNNNPVMNIDPDGTWSWKGVFKIVAAVAVVAAVTAAVVVTAGAVAVAVGASAATVTAVMTGAAIGGGIAGAAEIINQASTCGAENINLGSVAIETLTGSSIGAISAVSSTTGSVFIKDGCRIAKILISGGASFAHSLNEGDSFETAVEKSAFSMAFSTMFQVVGSKFGKDPIIGSSYSFGKMLQTGLTASGRALWRSNKNKLDNIFGTIFDVVF